MEEVKCTVVRFIMFPRRTMLPYCIVNVKLVSSPDIAYAVIGNITSDQPKVFNP